MRITSKKDLPAWFDLERYNKFQSFDDDDLIYQLERRRIFKSTGGICDDDYFECHVKNNFDYSYIPILDAEDGKFMNVIEITDSEIDGYKNTAKLIDSGDALEPLDVDCIREINSELIICGSHPNFCDGDSHINALMGDYTRESEEIYCRINLFCSDDFIIDDLKNLLPKWRKEFSLERNEVGIKNTWGKAREKILNYKAIALNDLLDWQKCSGNIIQNSVLAIALYPDGEYGESALIDTIKPFTEKLFTDEVIDKFKFEIQSRKNTKKSRR